ncbi:uncharacterized protein LOC122086753 [Macadamia integrifolia]|uniref:uncharacterized protein LOC122086753 n=1 Tax=Macadamia integrifolia TaxID=60698 RepID=UPI001C500790|nr:uncharacterized protein LOC122086753 [Macadamia integrifolia]
MASSHYPTTDVPPVSSFQRHLRRLSDSARISSESRPELLFGPQITKFSSPPCHRRLHHVNLGDNSSKNGAQLALVGRIRNVARSEFSDWLSLYKERLFKVSWNWCFHLASHNLRLVQHVETIRVPSFLNLESKSWDSRSSFRHDN